MALWWPALTSGPLGVVVRQIHGIDVVGHVWSSKHGKPIGQPVAANRQISIQMRCWTMLSFSNAQSLTCQSWCPCRMWPLGPQQPWPKQHELQRPACDNNRHRIIVALRLLNGHDMVSFRCICKKKRHFAGNKRGNDMILSAALSTVPQVHQLQCGFCTGLRDVGGANLSLTQTTSASLQCAKLYRRSLRQVKKRPGNAAAPQSSARSTIASLPTLPASVTGTQRQPSVKNLATRKKTSSNQMLHVRGANKPNSQGLPALNWTSAMTLFYGCLC